MKEIIILWHFSMAVKLQLKIGKLKVKQVSYSQKSHVHHMAH